MLGEQLRGGCADHIPNKREGTHHLRHWWHEFSRKVAGARTSKAEPDTLEARGKEMERLTKKIAEHEEKLFEILRWKDEAQARK